MADDGYGYWQAYSDAELEAGEQADREKYATCKEEEEARFSVDNTWGLGNCTF